MGDWPFKVPSEQGIRGYCDLLCIRSHVAPLALQADGLPVLPHMWCAAAGQAGWSQANPSGWGGVRCTAVSGPQHSHWVGAALLWQWMRVLNQALNLLPGNVFLVRCSTWPFIHILGFPFSLYFLATCKRILRNFLSQEDEHISQTAASHRWCGAQGFKSQTITTSFYSRLVVLWEAQLSET